MESFKVVARVVKYLGSDWLTAAERPRLFAERVCVLCGAQKSMHGIAGICGRCWDDLPAIETACATCGVQLSRSAPRCGRCERHPPAFDRCVVPFAYGAPVDRFIKDLKFGGALAAARELAAWFVERAKLQCMPKRIVPVPLHPRRLRERGYNQASVLGEQLSEQLGIPLDLTGCRRRVYTAPQSELDAKARRANVRGAFEVVRRLRGERVAVIDDVVTTGSTANELAKTLKRAGAAWVEIWAMGRGGQGPRR